MRARTHTHTHLQGRGHRIWLEVRRFKTTGGEWSKGVAMTADNLYMGKILLDLVGPNADAEAKADKMLRLGAADRAPGAVLDVEAERERKSELKRMVRTYQAGLTLVRPNSAYLFRTLT